MKYYKNFATQSDPQKLAEMLAMQEANQRINSDYGALPSMSGGDIDPMKMKMMMDAGKEMRKKLSQAKNKEIGKNTYDTTASFSTEGLA